MGGERNKWRVPEPEKCGSVHTCPRGRSERRGSAKTTYGGVDGFQCFPLELILALSELVVRVLVEFLDFLYHLQWTDKRGQRWLFHEQMSLVSLCSCSVNRFGCLENVTLDWHCLSRCLQAPSPAHPLGTCSGHFCSLS